MQKNSRRASFQRKRENCAQIGQARVNLKMEDQNELFLIRRKRKDLQRIREDAFQLNIWRFRQLDNIVYYDILYCTVHLYTAQSKFFGQVEANFSSNVRNHESLIFFARRTLNSHPGHTLYT